MKYNLPFSIETKSKIAKPKGIYAHENYPESKYAVDFILEIGTPILPSRGGKIWKIKSDSEKWGLDPNFAKEANFVAIDHGDGTYAEYLHLGKEKVTVEIGQEVKAGDLLGYSGLSGCMDLPHLHFNIFKIENKKGISIPFELEDVRN